MLQTFCKCGELRNVTIARKKDRKRPGQCISLGKVSGSDSLEEKNVIQNHIKLLLTFVIYCKTRFAPQPKEAAIRI